MSGDDCCHSNFLLFSLLSNTCNGFLLQLCKSLRLYVKNGYRNACYLVYCPIARVISKTW